MGGWVGGWEVYTWEEGTFKAHELDVVKDKGEELGEEGGHAEEEEEVELGESGPEEVVLS